MREELALVFYAYKNKHVYIVFTFPLLAYLTSHPSDMFGRFTLANI